jgi:hypothetical protein
MTADRYKDVHTYVTFIGNGRTGTSLTAAIIDAHPNAIVSHQLRAIRRLRKLSRVELFNEIAKNSSKHSRKGKPHYQYRYAIPGTWQGQADPIRVIGDKYAGPDTDRLAKNDFELLNELEKTMSGLRLKFVHAVRNPYDAITTHKRRYYTTLGRALRTCGRREVAVERIKVLGYDVLDIHLEHLVESPVAVIGHLYSWLGLKPDRDLVDRCASVVFDQTRITRNSIRWSSRSIAVVEQMIERFEWLNGYHWD